MENRNLGIYWKNVACELLSFKICHLNPQKLTYLLALLV